MQHNTNDTIHDRDRSINHYIHQCDISTQKQYDIQNLSIINVDNKPQQQVQSSAYLYLLFPGFLEMRRAPAQGHLPFPQAAGLDRQSTN
jgi:hypothetical protein